MDGGRHREGETSAEGLGKVLLNQVLKKNGLPAEKSSSGAKNPDNVIEISSPSDGSDPPTSNQRVEVNL